MTHILFLFQIWRWVMQPKVWRFVGFASAVVGLLCYALSSSFNYLFGDWNLFKIFIYTVFSFIICMVILFAKLLQHSRSLRFKAHTAFFVLAITSLYSFFFDKVVNGKPDAYSLISCASFAIMSLSLSRQTQCGFEVDLLYFFLGCLIVQLMKIKLQLFIVGAGFSYSLIILRSSFSSIDAGENNQYTHLQDGNSVVLSIDSLQLTSTDIASASNNISISSPQLVITTDISSMMEQLRTFVTALRHENSNFIQMLLEHVEKYSEFAVTDPNFMMDALKPETIKGLEEIANVMISAGFEKDFSDVYNNCRRECLNECLMQRLLGLKKLNMEDVHTMPWEDLEDEIERWIRASNAAFKILFPGERRLCDRVFFGFKTAADFSFMEICRESTIQFLNFADFVSSGSHSPERLFKILEVFETLWGLIQESVSLFGDQYRVSLRNEAVTIWKSLGKAILDIFKELEYLIGRDLSKVTDLGGGLHPITQHVMNYLRLVCLSQQTLEKVFTDSSLSWKMQEIMAILESNLEEKSKCYEDPSLGYLFLMNNNTYIVKMIKHNELGSLLGDDWFKKHSWKVWHYNEQFQKTKGSISPTLVQDLFWSKNLYGNVQQQLYSTHQIGEIDKGMLEGFEGSTAYKGYGNEIEASPSRPGKRSTKTGMKMEIRTIVIFPTPQVRKVDKMALKDDFPRSKYAKREILGDKMPPEDGFIWIKYGEKDILGFKYSRSYYRCKHLKACRATKRVQQVAASPNMFEVRYYNGHSCNVSLKIPSLFAPAREAGSITKDIIKTTIHPSSPTSYFKWMSSSKPANSITSIPKAMLAAPADGGHHPMLENVMDYLVIAIRSQPIKDVHGDPEFSFSADTEGAMKQLESILASKSEKYVDTSLRHLFMMNNWRYLEVANKRWKLEAIFKDVWLQVCKGKVLQYLQHYQRNSWDKVLEFLKLDINDSMEMNVSVDLMKEKLSLFNMHFTETCRVQCSWSVHDEKLRGEIIESLKNMLLPPYGIFIGKFQDIVKNNAYEYIEYGMFDIHDILDNLFLGKKKHR